MSTSLAPPAQQEVPRKKGIPSQPVVNIGTSGHVDHGKCLAIDEYILFNGSLTTGREILEILPTKGTLLRTTDGGLVYQLEENRVISIDQELRTKGANSLFYCQEYSGAIYKITTKTGRSVSVTPDHPLLVNRRGAIGWQKARELRPADHVAFTSFIPSMPARPFPDPIEKLKREHNVITFEEYQRLRKITDGFTNFSSLSGRDFDQLRMLASLSRPELSGRSDISSSTLSSILQGTNRVSSSLLCKLITAFKELDFFTLSPDEFLIGFRGNDRNVTKIRDQSLDSDMIKWLAFVWSEGTSEGCRIAVAQRGERKMLEEFLGITRSKFNLEFKQVNEIDYHLNNRALVEYLKAKFDFRPGNEMICRIAPWVLGLPSELKRIFLRWYLTLVGKFNNRASQISITLRNDWNIVVIAYLLQMFGISPRFSKKRVSTAKGIITYTRLSVSGREGLVAFAKQIGFENPELQERLQRYLSSNESHGKGSNLSIPIDGRLLGDLLNSSGILRESRSRGNPPPIAKRSSWYKAYSTARATGRISRTMLLLFVEEVEKRLARLEDSLTRLDSATLLSHINIAGLSIEELGERANLSRKVLTRIIRQSGDRSGEITEIAKNITTDKLEQCRVKLLQLKQIANSPLEFDQIRSIQVKPYSGQIFDLTVPEHSNFIAGNGAIVCHNTTLVQAITGIWTSAHSEELRRGITIKVGYADTAFYKCENCPAPECYSTDPSCPKCPGNSKLLRVVSFVDAPGHESLMANMLSGAAVMDGAILVISASEKVPQPQTREHLLALQMLGMKHIVIVQNKVDLVTDKEANLNYLAIRNFVAGSVAANAPIIPISAQHSLNIDALIESIEQNIPTPQRDESAKPLMQVLRSFDVNHPGLSHSQLSGGVLGGTLLQGTLSVGEEIELRPGILEEGQTKAEPIVTKVTALISSAGKTDRVHPGGLIAVGTMLDPFYTRSDSLVGAVLGRPNELPPVFETLNMDIKLFETAVGTQELVKVDRIKMGEVLRLNIGTGVTVGVVSSSREAIVDAKLKKPVCASRGDRIAISRRIGDRWRLIGAGTVR